MQDQLTWVKNIRRDLHRIPEIGFDLPLTSAYVRDCLLLMGYTPISIAETGWIVVKEGASSEAIAFRADMDALNVTEMTGVPFESSIQGHMHACGHDGHMTMNLLLAKYLADFPDQRKRSVLLIFQPGEEGPGGAKPMIDAGIFKRYPVKAIFGYHLFPFLDEGKLGTKAGPMMGQNSEFFITVHGISGHAAEPQRSMDAIVASASLITAFQSIVSRNTNPMESVVISIGLLNGGTRVNVVADEVKLGGTIRSFSDKSHAKLHQRIGEVVKGVELTHGCNIELEFVDMYPPVINNEGLYDIFKELIPPENRVRFRKVMLSEDFSYFQKEVPGLYIGLGTGNEEKGYNKNLHTSDFNFDESVLLNGLEASLKFINYLKNY